MSRRDRGLTLIELVAAMAILAVVSLMAVQTLGAALLQRDILARADTQGADLIRTLTLLRRDLEAAAPVPLVAGPFPSPSVETAPDGFVLMRAGLGAGPGAIGRVAWRVTAAGQLTRQVVLAGDVGPPVAMLDGVRGLRLRELDPPERDGDNRAALPAGFELTFDHAGHGALRLVVAR